MNRKKVFKLIFTFSIVLSSNLLFTQQHLHKIYSSVVWTTYGKKVRGYLQEVTDSTLITSTHIRGGKSDTIYYYNIIKARLIRTGSGGLGFLIGASTSIGIGILVALNAPKDDENLQVLGGLVGGFAAAIPAGVTGAVIGSSSGKGFHIDTDFEKFSVSKNQMKARARNQQE
jgi:hypothetical protein